MNQWLTGCPGVEGRPRHSRLQRNSAADSCASCLLMNNWSVMVQYTASFRGIFMNFWWSLTLNISQLQELVCFRRIITYTDSVLTSLDYLKYFKCPVPLGHPQLSGSILKEDFLGATVFTLAAASLQGETLLEREESLATRDAGNLCFPHQVVNDYNMLLEFQRQQFQTRLYIPGIKTCANLKFKVLHFSQCDCVLLHHSSFCPTKHTHTKSCMFLGQAQNWTLDSTPFLWWFLCVDVFGLVMFRRTASLVWSFLGFTENNSEGFQNRCSFGHIQGGWLRASRWMPREKNVVLDGKTGGRHTGL